MVVEVLPLHRVIAYHRRPGRYVAPAGTHVVEDWDLRLLKRPGPLSRTREFSSDKHTLLCCLSNGLERRRRKHYGQWRDGPVTCRTRRHGEKPNTRHRGERTYRDTVPRPLIIQQLLNIAACSNLFRTFAVELRERHALKLKKVGYIVYAQVLV
jgi:hypothetical protein